MNILLHRVRRFFATPGAGEVTHANWELTVMRIAFALLVAATIDWDVNFATQPKPHGFGKWMDFTFLSNPGLVDQLRAISIVCLTAYACGILPHLALTFVAGVAISIGTLTSSQGAVGHHTQVVILTVLAQALAHWTSPSLFTTPKLENRAVQWSLVTIAGGYMVSAFVKLIRSYGLWAWNSPALAVQFLKTRQMEYFDYLEVGLSNTFVDRMPELILAYPNIARLAFGSALFLEAFCFLILLGRRWSALYGLALIGMHISISIVMRHHFDFNIAAILIFLVNPIFWIMVAAKRIKGRSHLPL